MKLNSSLDYTDELEHRFDSLSRKFSDLEYRFEDSMKGKYNYTYDLYLSISKISIIDTYIN